jgi:uncharacterized protein YdhG (YjbR/CyaY superfamily)
MPSTTPARRALCALIRKADRRVTESVKWNAPSFAITGHFATLRAQPDLLWVVLHTDAKPTAKPKAIRVDDPTGLLTWPAKDRAVARFADAADVRKRGAAFVRILEQWIAQTQGTPTRPARSPAAARGEARAKARAKAPTAAAQITAYLATLAPEVRAQVKRIRAAARAAAPEAVEHFSYRIPGLRLDGKALLYYAGWKAHVSIYPIFESIVKEHRALLKGCTASKGTVRFPLESPPSAAAVRALVRARIRYVREGGPEGKRWTRNA